MTAFASGAVQSVVVVGGGVVVNRDNQRLEGCQELEAPQLQCVPCWLMFARNLPARCTICVSFSPVSAHEMYILSIKSMRRSTLIIR